MDKDELKAAVDAVHENQKVPGLPGGCCCPQIIHYFIWTECLTINNGACPDWDFCERCGGDC